ncbi:hypothetical protein Q1695_008346 [Nippostrongylus brasiliensis]|nr:hypothetical protein Q1695_008346 [Nippostrongylus brasiliensis]
MSWATVDQMGCGVAQCGSVYNVVRRYSLPPSTCDGSLCVRTEPTTTAPTTEAPTTAAPTTTAGGSGGTGGSTSCSPEQSEQLRQKVVDMINYRRDQLAQGKVAKNNGALLPAAANMLKLSTTALLKWKR